MSDWTVIISGGDDLTLAERLASAGGLDVLAVPDVYDLPDGHAALAAIGELTGPLAVVAPYYGRATYWTLAANGITGRRADVEGTETETETKTKTKTTGRAVHPIDLTDLDTDGAAEAVLTVTGTGTGGGVTDRRDETLTERWYPVIDFDRCTHCYECVEFCLFGVYEVDPAEEVHAAVPDNCKPGCPACSRVCPAAALIFPRYGGRGPIAGADEGRPDQAKGDAAREVAADDVKAYHSQHRAAKAAAADKADTPAQTDATTQTDATDRLIDDLDTFEA